MNESELKKRIEADVPDGKVLRVMQAEDGSGHVVAHLGVDKMPPEFEALIAQGHKLLQKAIAERDDVQLAYLGGAALEILMRTALAQVATKGGDPQLRFLDLRDLYVTSFTERVQAQLEDFIAWRKRREQAERA